MNRASSSTARGTSLGVLAILLWSSTIGVTRIATENLGILTTAGLSMIGAGVVLCLIALARGRLVRILRLPLRFLIVCGALFALYDICLYGAIGLASGREETIAVGLANYMWPTMVLALSVPLLHSRWRWSLIPGVLVAFGGVVLAAMDVYGLSLAGLVGQVGVNAVAFGIALVAAVLWGLYSNLSRRWGGPQAPSPIPIFTLATGLALLAWRLMVHEDTTWSLGSAAVLGYIALLPTAAAALCWDISMRTGNFVVVASLSYLTPLLSTCLTSIVLGRRPGPLMWAGAILVAAGAVICRLSLREQK